MNDRAIGHAWLVTDKGSFARGHYLFPGGSSGPAEYLRGPSPRAGATQDNSKRPWDRRKHIKHVEDQLKNSMNSHDKDAFDLSDMGASNCACQACERLQKAGFSPPSSPMTTKLKPA